MERSSGPADAAVLEGRARSADGTAIAFWRYPPADGPSEGPGQQAPGPTGLPPDTERHALLLVHGTTADHTTFRVVGPRLAVSRPTFALDRRGREASGDTLPYAIEREFEDVASVATRLAATSGGPIDVVGHSLGGRCALGGALLTPAIRRVVSYEGAVPPGVGEGRPGLLSRLERLDAAGDGEALLHAFLTEVVGLTSTEWEAFRASPVWPARLAAAHTVVRELRAGADPGSAWERYTDLGIPVLQVLGSESPPFFRAGARALDARLPRGRVAVIEGARHAAHHTHAGRFIELVERFLDAPDPA